MRRLFLYALIFVLILPMVGCNKLSVAQYDEKKSQYCTDINEIVQKYYLEIQEVSQGKEMSHDLYNEYSGEIQQLFDNVFKLKDQVPKERVEDWSNLNGVANALFILNMYSMRYDVSNEQDQKYIQGYCNDIIKYAKQDGIEGQ